MRQSLPAVSRWAEPFGYVRATKVGPLVEVGGTVALGEDGEVVGPEDVFVQTRRSLEIIAAAVESFDLDRGAIFRTRVFLRRIDSWEEAGRAHREFFAGHPLPTSSCVGGVDLLLPTLEVEVEASAWAG
jgi:enamine deaminase RidA (YjgF/YER057c/UK114 family)